MGCVIWISLRCSISTRPTSKVELNEMVFGGGTNIVCQAVGMKRDLTEREIAFNVQLGLGDV